MATWAEGWRVVELPFIKFQGNIGLVELAFCTPDGHCWGKKPNFYFFLDWAVGYYLLRPFIVGFAVSALPM